MARRLRGRGATSAHVVAALSQAGVAIGTPLSAQMALCPMPHDWTLCCAVLCHASIHHEQAKLLFVWEWVLSFWTGFLFGFPTVLAYIIVALSLRYSGSLDSKDALSTFGSLSVAAASISQFIGAVCSIPYIISQLGSLVGYTNRVGQVVDALNVTHSLPSPSRPSSPLLRTVEVELTSPLAAAPDDTTLDGDTCQEATSTTPLLSLAHRTLLSSHQVWF